MLTFSAGACTGPTPRFVQCTLVSDPMKQFYQALERQWQCLARLAEREALNSNEVDATKAAA